MIDLLIRAWLYYYQLIPKVRKQGGINSEINVRVL